MTQTFYVGRSTDIEVDASGAAITLSDGWGGGDLVLVFTSATAADSFATKTRTTVRILEDTVAEAYAEEVLAQLAVSPIPRHGLSDDARYFANYEDNTEDVIR